MTRVAVGIHLHTEPDRLRATLDHLRRHTCGQLEIMLLPDGPDSAMQALIETLIELPRYPTSTQGGQAASFNLLQRGSDADVLIFLEAGSLVGPSWLDHLLAALHADPANGLAGPSTNLSWNVQASFPRSGAAEIARTAALAARRYAGAWVSLESLYCLADFCYAVRRDVIEAVGDADEGYGAGPCWEMDYTVRAARAGFRPVWAQSAFVHRMPFTARRRRDEDLHFDASKHRFQDKFCGLRLSGERTGYVAHCRGKTCAHFAPTNLVAARPASSPGDVASRMPQTAAPFPPRQPLVSCIMPTRDRLDWMLQAVSYFQRQTYAERELIVIDDGAVDHADELPCDPRIRYVHVGSPLSIGVKRNRACELARGAFIIHWDDDDWYGPGRITEQVASLQSGAADITGLADPCFAELSRWEFWVCTTELYRRLFVLDVHGGTLAFRREVFVKWARYPDSSLAEDAVFLRTAVNRGARLQRIPARDLFVYVRHGRNAWAFTSGHHLDPRGWRRVAEPEAWAADRSFYASRSGRAAAHPRAARAQTPIAAAHRAQSAPAMPQVTCIMPTRNRRPFVSQAIEYFLRQNCPRAELVIVDDGDDRVVDLVPDDPSIRYLSLSGRASIGAKRNAAIEAGSGEIIVHWDDDDWMGAGRVAHQVNSLVQSAADICGTSRIRFYDVATGRFSVYSYPMSKRRWLYGATLCYRRSLWERKRFESIDVGEDTQFVWAQPQGRVLDLGDLAEFVAVVHAGNISRPRPMTGPYWSAWSGGVAEHVFGSDWHFYLAMAGTVGALCRRRNATLPSVAPVRLLGTEGCA